MATDPARDRGTTALATNELWSQMDRLFEELWGDPFARLGPTATGVLLRQTAPATEEFRPALVDVVDTGSAYEFRADLPGVPKDRIDVRVRGHSVEIEADATTDVTEAGSTFVRRERVRRGFRRAFALPEGVLEDRAEAKYENGVLTVTVPKARPVADRKVPVA